MDEKLYDREWRIVVSNRLEEQGKLIQELRVTIALLSQSHAERNQTIKEVTQDVSELKTFQASARGAQAVLVGLGAVVGAVMGWMIEFLKK